VQAEVVNYYQGHWIDHPAQSNLHQIPEPMRTIRKWISPRRGRHPTSGRSTASRSTE
jgi:hypothetical protein